MRFIAYTSQSILTGRRTVSAACSLQSVGLSDARNYGRSPTGTELVDCDAAKCDGMAVATAFETIKDPHSVMLQFIANSSCASYKIE